MSTPIKALHHSLNPKVDKECVVKVDNVMGLVQDAANVTNVGKLKAITIRWEQNEKNAGELFPVIGVEYYNVVDSHSEPETGEEE